MRQPTPTHPQNDMKADQEEITQAVSKARAACQQIRSQLAAAGVTATTQVPQASGDVLHDFSKSLAAWETLQLEATAAGLVPASLCPAILGMTLDESVSAVLADSGPGLAQRKAMLEALPRRTGQSSAQSHSRARETAQAGIARPGSNQASGGNLETIRHTAKCSDIYEITEAVRAGHRIEVVAPTPEPNFTDAARYSVTLSRRDACARELSHLHSLPAETPGRSGALSALGERLEKLDSELAACREVFKTVN